MPNSLELNVSPAQLHTFANHPFHVRKDMEMNELVDSIRESGVIVPLIVRSRPEGGYEIISGHRRCEACREFIIRQLLHTDRHFLDTQIRLIVTSDQALCSEIPSVLSGINRIQRWSQSKLPYLVFVYFFMSIYSVQSRGWGAIRNKHPFGHDADFCLSPASSIQTRGNGCGRE